MLLALPFDVLMQVFAAFRAPAAAGLRILHRRALEHVLAHGAQRPFPSAW
jgi:hypothetical protein